MVGPFSIRACTTFQLMSFRRQHLLTSYMVSTDNAHVESWHIWLLTSSLPLTSQFYIQHLLRDIHLQIHGPRPTYHWYHFSYFVVVPCTFVIPIIECFCLSGLSLDQLEFGSGLSTNAFKCISAEECEWWWPGRLIHLHQRACDFWPGNVWFPADFQPDIRWFCPLQSGQNPEIKAHQSGEEHQVNYGVITIYCIVLSPWIQYIFTLGSGQSLEIKAN